MTIEDGRAWRCGVCGYIHHGAEAPESCPVCGAAREEFEPYQEEVSRAAEHKVGRWRCLDCGYIHSGSAPPNGCPACGAPADRFEPITEAAEEAVNSSQAAKIIVVGAGIAGLAAVESLRAASSTAEITLISGEAHLPYYRLNLTRYMAGEITADSLPIHPAAWYEEQNVRLLRGREVVGFTLDPQVVAMDDGQELPFDKLVLAAGASPMIPSIPGVTRENVLSVRTVDDANVVLGLARPGTRCVCIGGGILGLETAGALVRRGVEVSLLENHGWLLPRQLNETAGRILEQRVTGLGIKLHHLAHVAEIVGTPRVQGVRLEGGPVLPAEFVIIATGIRSNVELAQRAGLAVNRGVLVDNHLTTSHPNVLAAGDLAEHAGVVYGLWVASQFQGNIAGLNAAGRKAQFGGIPKSNSLKVLGIELFSIGVVEAGGAGFEEIDQEMDDRYLRFVFRDNRLVGAILLGDAEATVPVKKAIESSLDLGDLLRTTPTAAEISAALMSAHS
jgi:nitrite reductase (NADH) large subunit